MIDAETIYLVTHNIETEEFEVSTLLLWINRDRDFFLKKDNRRKQTWVILSAHGSRSEAQHEVERLESPAE